MPAHATASDDLAPPVSGVYSRGFSLLLLGILSWPIGNHCSPFCDGADPGVVGPVQHSLPWQRGTHPTMALALINLSRVICPLNGPGAPGLREPRPHGGLVVAQSGSKCDELWDGLLGYA